MPVYPILVAYDGSDGAQDALRWGVAEAGRRRLPVQVVTVLDGHRFPSHALDKSAAPQALAEADPVLDKAVHEACAEAPDVTVTGWAVPGPVVDRLCDLSPRACMVVLGSRGHGGFAGLLIGSVSVAVCAHARCTVVVVPRDARPLPGTPIVVGVDDSPQARLAVWFAIGEAASRGVDLLAVHARQGRPEKDGTGRSDVRIRSVASAQRLVDEMVREPHARYPHVAIRTLVEEGTPGDLLSNLSSSAQLLVVGSRGLGGFHGLLLGSACQQVLHHAHCPVAVARDAPSCPVTP